MLRQRREQMDRREYVYRTERRVPFSSCGMERKEMVQTRGQTELGSHPAFAQDSPPQPVTILLLTVCPWISYLSSVGLRVLTLNGCAKIRSLEN